MDKGEGKRKVTNPLELFSRYKYVLLLAAVGAILMLWPLGGDTAGGGVEQPADSNLDREVPGQLEEDMEAILGKMSGVGRVDVMLTMHSGSELVLANNTTLRYSGSTNAPDDYDRTSETVTVSNGGGEDVFVTQQRCPQYRGALVVCDGGSSDSVRLQVMEAVSALTGLGSDKIAVVPWQTGAQAKQEG